MATVVRDRSTSRRRTVLYSVGAALLVLLLVAGLAFVNSLSVTRVTNNARSLHWNNAAIGTSALTRAGLVQATTFYGLRGNGVVTSEDVSFAREQVDASVAELEHLLEIGSQHDSYGALARFVSRVGITVAALDSGDPAGARLEILDGLEPAYVELSSALEVEQGEIQDAIADNSALGRAVNSWVVFVLTLAVPGSAVAVYFVVVRRQIRSFKERSRIELEAEREISRAKDSFIAGLSHELRTPLTSIYGFAEILSDGGVQGVEATRETAQIIANESAEMTRMVDDLLAASRLESTGLEVELVLTPLRDVIESAVSPFTRAGIEISRAPTSAFVSTDASRLRHVLVNLLSNAVRHGGQTIALEVTSGDATLDIEVVDDGPGVPDDKVASLFDRFAHSGDAPLLTGSVGLGLAVAARLTELIGGTLQHQRYNGKTYFIVTLPAQPEVDDGEHDQSVAEMIRSLSS